MSETAGRADQSPGRPEGGRRNLALLTAAMVAIIALGAGLVYAAGSGDDDSKAAVATTGPSASTSTSAPVGSTTITPGETPTTSAPATSTTIAGDCPSNGWTDRQRLAQVLMIGVDPSSTADATSVVERAGVGGIFIGGNDTTLITSGVLGNLRGPSDVAPFVAVDDEGGRVQRIDALMGDLPSARVLAATQTADEVRALMRQRGERLASYGINVNFAPDVDVSDQADGEVIGDRSFSNDPEVVNRYGAAVADGLHDAGILAVFKHFPGHGHARGDSHKGTSTTPPFDQLGPDLTPYRDLLADRPDAAVMVGHLVVPGLTDGQPASLSPQAIDGQLRGELGFHGLVFTDDLGGMRAITANFDRQSAVRLALVAGADVALLSDDPKGVDALLDALEADLGRGQFPRAALDRAVSHILVAKGYEGCDR